jgi:hypothetical protein
MTAELTPSVEQPELTPYLVLVENYPPELEPTSTPKTDPEADSLRWASAVQRGALASIYGSGQRRAIDCLTEVEAISLLNQAANLYLQRVPAESKDRAHQSLQMLKDYMWGKSRDEIAAEHDTTIAAVGALTSKTYGRMRGAVRSERSQGKKVDTPASLIDDQLKAAEHKADMYGDLDRADWTGAALCAYIDARKFQVIKGRNNDFAKFMCSQCTVRDQCLDAALSERSVNNSQVILGGKTPSERRRMI